MRRRLLLLAGVWLLLATAGCAVMDPRQADVPPPGIAREETVVLGGLPERLLIRGRDPARNPVLLFLHGGPGFPAAPFGRVNSDLERDFTVVHWDQRGAGHSFRADIPERTMRVETFVDETIALSRQLARRFGQRKIYLVGHSWGSLVGALAARREPGLFHAYVGLGQLVDIAESERELTLRGLALARAQGRTREEAVLTATGYGPFHDLTVQDRTAGIVHSLRPKVQNEATHLRLAALAATSRYYTLADLTGKVLPGYNFSRRLLNPQLYAHSLYREAPQLDVPVYLFAGRQDTEVGATVIARYYARLRAPRGKQLVWFNISGHWPHLEEPGKFAAEMRRVREETRNRKNAEPVAPSPGGATPE